MKYFSIFILMAFLSAATISANNEKDRKTLHDFTVKDIDGKDYDLSILKGKKVLIVNVASKCGLTPQYEKLEALYKKYKDKNFVIIGFPSDNFAGQEFQNNEEIKSFCSLNYGVTFPIMSRVDVKGENQAPIFTWLTQQAKNGEMDIEIRWNFQKFMIDENGNLIDYVVPRESPDSKKIIDWIENK